MKKELRMSDTQRATQQSLLTHTQGQKSLLDLAMQAGFPLTRKKICDIYEPVGGKLEISPFVHPFFHSNVKYFSMHDLDELEKRAIRFGLTLEEMPERLDFVNGDADLKSIDEKFDLVFSSHVIEHVPDLVRHLNDVAQLLRENGIYVAIIPDYRYCFDHFRRPTNIYDILSDYAAVRHTPDPGRVLELDILKAHNDPARHWRGDHGKTDPDPQQIRARVEMIMAREGYCDTHNYKFAPRSFMESAVILRKMGLLELRLAYVRETFVNELEFVAIFVRDGLEGEPVFDLSGPHSLAKYRLEQAARKAWRKGRNIIGKLKKLR